MLDLGQADQQLCLVGWVANCDETRIDGKGPLRGERRVQVWLGGTWLLSLLPLSAAYHAYGADSGSNALFRGAVMARIVGVNRDLWDASAAGRWSDPPGPCTNRRGGST